MTLDWSFKARLHNAAGVIKERFFLILDELTGYKGVKTTESWDRVRIHVGRNTYGIVFFKEQTLCAALALNPAEYTASKRFFKDVSGEENFASTPMLIQLTSDKQMQFLRDMFLQLFKGIEIVSANPIRARRVQFYEEEKLIEMGLIKVCEDKDATATVIDEQEPAKAKPKTAKTTKKTIAKTAEQQSEPTAEPQPEPEQKSSACSTVLKTVTL